MGLQAFQDQIHGNSCFGCGAENISGLRIKSFWIDDTKTAAECLFRPQPHHSAGPPNVLNGGIISTIIDCHGVCTAMAKAYAEAGRDIGTGDPIWYATGQLVVNFRRPVPIDGEVRLVAGIDEVETRKTRVSCQLFSGDKICADAKILAVPVVEGWTQGHAKTA